MVIKKKILLLLAPVTLLFNGCGTPLEIRAVQQYAQFQTQSGELFPKIAEDVYRSCIRSIDYVILNRQTIRHLQEWLRHSWSSFRMSPMRSLTSGWRSPTNENYEAFKYLLILIQLKNCNVYI